MLGVHEFIYKTRNIEVGVKSRVPDFEDKAESGELWLVPTIHIVCVCVCNKAFLNLLSKFCRDG